MQMTEDQDKEKILLIANSALDHLQEKFPDEPLGTVYAALSLLTESCQMHIEEQESEEKEANE